jgi:hypothetical protein
MVQRGMPKARNESQLDCVEYLIISALVRSLMAFFIKPKASMHLPLKSENDGRGSTAVLGFPF